MASISENVASNIFERLVDGNSEKIGHQAKLPSLEYYSSLGFIHFDSRKLIYDKLLEEAKNSDSNMFALQGIGGLGKTTMAIKVGEIVEKENHFDKVIFVTVSKNPQVRKIQEEITTPLVLEFERIENNSNRAKRHSQRLSYGERILLILDDVWENLNFEEIGIPFDDSHKGCRVFLITRNLTVCCLMGRHGSIIQLNILSENEAWNFFQKHSGIDASSSKKLKDTAEEISKECKGLLISLATIGSTLKNQPLEDWSAALKILKNPTPVDIADHDLSDLPETKSML